MQIKFFVNNSYDFPTKSIPWRDSNPGLLILRRMQCPLRLVAKAYFEFFCKKISLKWDAWYFYRKSEIMYMILWYFDRKSKIPMMLDILIQKVWCLMLWYRKSEICTMIDTLTESLKYVCMMLDTLIESLKYVCMMLDTLIESMK
jgi:hypothetical protein